MAADENLRQAGNDDLAGIVEAAGVGAITIDTSIFDRFGCDLESRSIAALEQFAGSPVSYLLSDVVLGELRSHMLRDASSATAETDRALKVLAKSRQMAPGAIDDARRALGLQADLGAEVNARIARHLGATEGQTLDAGQLLDADALLADYFATAAPFERGKNKRAEFPDAIALLELEHWAEINQTCVLAVTADAGWAAYSSRSARILVIDDLAAALALFNKVDRHVVERAAALMGDVNRVAAREVAGAIERFIDGMTPHVQAQSHLFFDADLFGVEIKEWTPPAPHEISVIDQDDDVLTLAFTIDVIVEAEAGFTFSIRDSWDGDHVSVGGASEIRDIVVPVPLVAKVSREGGPDEFLRDVAAENQRYVPLDFSQVGPDDHD